MSVSVFDGAVEPGWVVPAQNGVFEPGLFPRREAYRLLTPLGTASSKIMSIFRKFEFKYLQFDSSDEHGVIFASSDSNATFHFGQKVYAWKTSTAETHCWVEILFLRQFLQLFEVHSDPQELGDLPLGLLACCSALQTRQYCLQTKYERMNHESRFLMNL